MGYWGKGQLKLKCQRYFKIFNIKLVNSYNIVSVWLILEFVLLDRNYLGYCVQVCTNVLLSLVQKWTNCADTF